MKGLLNKLFLGIVCLYVLCWSLSLDSMTLAQMCKGLPIITVCMAYLVSKAKAYGYWN